MTKPCSPSLSATGKPKPKSAYFPIADSATELEKVIKGRCKDIPADIVSFARQFKPYKGGNDLIWVLNQAAIASKHHLLAPTGRTVGAVNIGRLMASNVQNFRLPAPRWNARENEMIYAVIGPHAQFEYQIQFAGLISFAEIELVENEPAIGVLYHITGVVESIVAGIEAEARRIGLFG